MFILKSAKLLNFAAIHDSTFTPSEHGVTSIYGANGNGKSSFLDAVIWALFGTVPKDKKQIDMRSFNASEKDKTVVVVTFEHNGDTIEVTRSLNAKGTATAEIVVNGEKLTKTTPTTAVNWIKKRLGINEEGFTKAFAIKQKQLDDLVSALPTERRRIIERISGVERLSLALKYAKEAEKTAKTLFDNADNPEAELVEAREQKAQEEKKQESAQNELDEASAESHMLLKDRKNAYEAWQEEERKRQSYIAALSSLDKLRQSLELVNVDMENKRANLAALKKNTEGDAETLKTELDKAEAVLADLREKSRAIREEERELRDRQSQQSYKRTSAESEVTGHKQSITSLKEQIEDAQAHLATAVPEKNITKAEAKAEKARNESSEHERTIALREQLIELTERNISMLSEGDHSECPMCHQGIADTSAVRAEMEQSLREHQKEKAKAEKAHEKAQALLAKTEAEISQMQEQNAQAAQGEENLARLTDALEASETALDASLSALEACEAEDFAQEIAEAEKRAEENLAQGQEAAEKVRVLKEALASVDEITRLEQDIAEQSEIASELGSQIEDAQGNLPEVVDENEIASMKQKFDDLNDVYEDAKSREEKKVSEVYALRSAVDSLQKSVERYEAAEKSYLEAKGEYDKRHAVSHLLAEFRKDTISRIAPEIAASTSAVVSSMTSDEFTGILLDDEFTPTVVRANGREDPMHLLSGGEQSLVALALLIGIGDLLSGGAGGLLWLDEALVSQDANRRNLIASTLRNLPDRQLVMVNHTPDGNDLSDMVVELVKGEKGSYLRYE